MSEKSSHIICLLLGIAIGIICHNVYYCSEVDDIKQLKLQNTNLKYHVKAYKDYFYANECLLTKVYNEQYTYWIDEVSESDVFNKYIDAYAYLCCEYYDEISEMEYKIDSSFVRPVEFLYND